MDFFFVFFGLVVSLFFHRELNTQLGPNTDFHPEMQRQMINQVSFSSAVGVQTDQGRKATVNGEVDQLKVWHGG